MAHPHRVCRPMSTWLTQQQLYARVASIVACALVASACDLGKHTRSHTRPRERFAQCCRMPPEVMAAPGHGLVMFPATRGFEPNTARS